MNRALITGVGITSAIGQGKERFARALFGGEHAFAYMEREGRRKGSLTFVGAEIRELANATRIGERVRRRTSFCGLVALATVEEAWNDAGLDAVAPERIGLIVGGSNLQQREVVNATEAYASHPVHVSPYYSISLWDTDLCGLCTEAFPVRGMTYSLGGASASGQLAVMQAARAVESGELDACIALGALTDLSYLEFQALRNIGAMGTDRYADDPSLACRPFDRMRDGFIYGESCGAVVVEGSESAGMRRARSYGSIRGYATATAGNRNPNPDEQCEIAVIRRALKASGLSPAEVDYVSPHGSGSVIGDTTELNAVVACELSHAFINSTKSLTGHGLASAGAVEVIATLLQMEAGRLHPSRNLTSPEMPSLNWVGEGAINQRVRNALCLSYGFGGINTALCVQHEGL
ncbi:MAG TPA: beta-ketoacyl synthase N-terminal-like domain-containing protein [Pyrinomonadaceae bacterium]